MSFLICEKIKTFIFVMVYSLLEYLEKWEILIMKVLASDFDGTIFFENIDGGFKEEDLKAIQEFQKHGNLFGICTGRPLMGIKEVVKDKIKFDFYIISTGAVILDHQLKEIYKNCMTRERIQDIYQKYQDRTNVLIQANHQVYTFEKQDIPIQQAYIRSVDEIVGNDLYGVSLNAYNEENARLICQELNENYDDIEAFQNKEFIDIVSIGCSKGNAIMRLKEYFHLKDIAGIGDSYNDLSMLKVVDSAFTFVYSPDSIKENADFVVSSVKEAIDILSK